jgi:predicted metal-dependent phosphoesterase TrpH
MRPRNGGGRGHADMHIHSLYSDGTASVRDILQHVEEHTDLDVVAITDHERIDGALRAAELHAAGDYSFDLVVGEEVTTRRGHVLALFITERIPALRPLEESLRAIHRAGGVAIAAHPMAPLPLSVGKRSLRRVRDHEHEDVYFDALELFNPSYAGRTRHGARMDLNAAELGLPGVGNSDGHVLEGIGTGLHDVRRRHGPRLSRGRPGRGCHGRGITLDVLAQRRRLSAPAAREAAAPVAHDAAGSRRLALRR